MWKHVGVRIDNETPLEDENFAGRKPVIIHLKEGWNKIFFKLPYVPVDGIRLNKWMFTFVLTDVTGRIALHGIEYIRLLKRLDFKTSMLSWIVVTSHESI
ncbi:hypothetical protein [Hoylesella enoeca]|uniref:hypothetical protein n=1 Tax=Hoylesella enoeca TaxID=76123 RepID=UPI0006844B37|nr:hypothetical protein [Hoylesella enoeca]